MPFTAEELAELAAFDAEIDDSFQITPEEMAFSRAADRAAMLSRKDNRGRKIAERKKAYREANKDKVAEYQKAYYEANKDKVAEYKKAYYEANKDKVAEYKKAYYEANKDKVAEQRRRKRKEKHNAQSEVSRRHLSGQGPVGADPAV